MPAWLDAGNSSDHDERTKTQNGKRKTAEPSSSNRVVLYPVLRYDNPGQLTVPNHLSLGNDGKLCLTRSSEAERPKAKPQPISLKESVAWFRLGHSYGLSLTRGESFNEWLKMIEGALS
ncbi:MAG: hypothetical protein ABSD29_05295 [Verrucomicrobiota bacterium]